MTSDLRDLYCRELAEMVAACEEDDPSPSLIEKIEDHLRVCPVCQHAEAMINDSLQVFRMANPGDVSEDLEAALVSRLCETRSDGVEEKLSEP